MLGGWAKHITHLPLSFFQRSYLMVDHIHHIKGSLSESQWTPHSSNLLTAGLATPQKVIHLAISLCKSLFHFWVCFRCLSFFSKILICVMFYYILVCKQCFHSDEWVKVIFWVVSTVPFAPCKSYEVNWSLSLNHTLRREHTSTCVKELYNRTDGQIKWGRGGTSRTTEEG